MKIDVPYSYTIKGVPHGKRSEVNKTCYGIVEVDVEQVESWTTTEALILEGEGSNEYFLHFDGSFWIRNDRHPEDRFGAQHLHLLGQFPAKARQERWGEPKRTIPFTQGDADDLNHRSISALGKTGILAAITTERPPSQLADKTWRLNPPFAEEAGRTVIGTVDLAWELRTKTDDDEDERREHAVDHVRKNVRFVDGRLYHRVPQPELVATDRGVDWCFSAQIARGRTSFGQDREDRSFATGYKIPMPEIDNLDDILPSGAALIFSATAIDAACFVDTDIRTGIAMDVQTALEESFGLGKHPTPFIVDWCRLRDLVAAQETPLAERDDAFFDEAAEILEELGPGMRKDFKGAAIWRARSVDANPVAAETGLASQPA